jgi:hypothetical protein
MTTRRRKTPKLKRCKEATAERRRHPTNDNLKTDVGKLPPWAEGVLGRASAAGRAVLTGTVADIPDVQADPAIFTIGKTT